jgi:hypothetical protein
LSINKFARETTVLSEAKALKARTKFYHFVKPDRIQDRPLKAGD